MIEFNEGVPPNSAGNYWLRITNTNEHPVKGNHQSGVYAYKCACHSSEILGLSGRAKRNLELELTEITGWILLPDPSINN